MRFLPHGGLGTEVWSFSFTALKTVTSLDKSRSGDRDPQTVPGTGAPAKPSNARDQARAARGEAKLSPRPAAEDAAARAMTALKEKGNDGSVVPEVSRGRLPGDPEQWRGKFLVARRASVLPGRAGWCT